MFWFLVEFLFFFMYIYIVWSISLFTKKSKPNALYIEMEWPGTPSEISFKGLPEAPTYPRKKGGPCFCFFFFFDLFSCHVNYSEIVIYFTQVLEIRPTIKWDKGKALEFLLESLGEFLFNTLYVLVSKLNMW